MARLVLLRYLGQPPGLLLAGGAQPLLKHGPAIGLCGRQPGLDPGDGVRVIGGGTTALGLAGTAHLRGERLTARGSACVDEPVRGTDGGQQALRPPRLGPLIHVRTAQPADQVRGQLAPGRHVHPALRFLLEPVLGRQLIGDQRANTDDRVQYDRGLAGQVNPAVVDGEGIPHRGEQHITSGRRGSRPGQDQVPGVTGGQHPFGGLGEDRVTGGEQCGPVFPCDVGVGGDQQLLRKPVGVPQRRRKDHVRGVPVRFPEAAGRRHMPQPEPERRIGDGPHAPSPACSSCSPTKLSIAARLAR